MIRFAVVCGCILLSGCDMVPKRADYVARLEALALLQTLNADLLSHDSATLTLERWCGDHHIADPPRIDARRIREADKAIPDDLRARLQIDAAEPIAYRHVQLVCGAYVLSEADNWYVPSRLTPEMNRQLDTTDEPFGKVVKPLGFQRRTISAELLWEPLPRGWESRASENTGEAPNVPREVLRHIAILYTSAQMPFSAVVETYQGELLNFVRSPREH